MNYLLFFILFATSVSLVAQSTLTLRRSSVSRFGDAAYSLGLQDELSTILYSITYLHLRTPYFAI